MGWIAIALFALGILIWLFFVILLGGGALLAGG
jgi:hypothetical protein